ncbi:MAG: AsmA-like C-terminal region-containing protein [Bacteroidota bacterium]|nr:AsmA-like C-terminal region-containing protein [Bacteroidota bacterium]MDP3144006.1 AsmA-like C-terminal region-containing protein [Bacteroidota bacterium]
MNYIKYIKRFFIGLLSGILLLIIFVFILITFYKKEILSAVISNLKDDYGLVLKTEDINVSFFSNWPHASIQLKNTNLTRELFEDKPILVAQSVSLSFDIMKLLKKQFIVETVVIKNAQINLVKNIDGSKNFELKSKIKNSSSQSIKFEINKVVVKNTQFNFNDNEKKQKINIQFINNTLKFKYEIDGIEAKVLGEVNVGGLLFDTKKGAFLKNTRANLNLHVSLFTKSKSIFIHTPSVIIINEQNFLVNSFIELKENKQITLFIESKNVNYAMGKSLLNTKLKKMLSSFSVDNTINIKLLLISKLEIKQDPIIITHINGKNNNVTIGLSKIPYSQLSFDATIVSLDSSQQKGDTEHARIILKNIKGKIYDFPFTASVSIINFDEPAINIDANLLINASKINFKPGKDFILNGNCVAKIKYFGPANKLNKKEFLEAPMKLKADLFFNQLSYREIDKPYIYTINGKATLGNKVLQFDNLFIKTNAGSAVLKGKAEDFTNYVLGYSDGFRATLSAKTDSFNLNPYLTKETEKNMTNTQAGYKKTIKEEQSNFEFNVSLMAKKLFIRKVKAEEASIILSYNHKLLDVKSVNMNTCKGKLFAKGTIYNLKKITAEVKIDNVDVNELFNEFENFGQIAVESRHLQGTVFVDAKLKTDLDKNMEVVGKTMDGEIKLKLKEGHLINFEPIQNISDYVFRNRDFKDISFSEINETCKIKGFEMHIQELEIASNVLNLFVSGVYNFKGNSNINILIPWSNLKKRQKDHTPKNSNQSAENSKGLKLNYSGLPKKLKLSLGYK